MSFQRIPKYGDLTQTLKGTGFPQDPMIKEYIQVHFGYDPDFMVQLLWFWWVSQCSLPSCMLTALGHLTSK